jgi:hypothetical protein
MAVHENERDLLEDTVYRRLASLWSEFSDAYAVFDAHGPDQLLCAQKVLEALLDAFPLKHKRMQTVLLDREIGRLMTWDGDSNLAVNEHFKKVGNNRKAFSYMDTLTIDDVFQSVILATLKSSDNRALRAVYDQILDDLDDDKDLTFAHIQTICARQFRRRKERTAPPHRADTPRTTPAKLEKYNKYKHQGGHGHGVHLCNTLEQHGVRHEKVLHRAGLAGDGWNEPDSALFMAAQPYFPSSVPSDTDTDDDYAAVAASDSDNPDD